jgi:hypothetical protein
VWTWNVHFECRPQAGGLLATSRGSKRPRISQQKRFDELKNLVETAYGAAQTTGYFGAQFRRLTVRRGGKRAIMALARSLLVVAYHMIGRGTHSCALGPTTSIVITHRELSHASPPV